MTDPRVDGEDARHREVQSHMPLSFSLRRVIPPDVGIIGQSGYRSDQRCNHSRHQTIERPFIEAFHRVKVTDDIQNKTEREKSDRRMNEQWMKRMSQRPALEKLLDHTYFCSGRFAPALSATARHFFFECRATLMP